MRNDFYDSGKQLAKMNLISFLLRRFIWHCLLRVAGWLVNDVNEFQRFVKHSLITDDASFFADDFMFTFVPRQNPPSS